MQLKPQIRLNSVLMKELLICHQPLQVLDFCKNCSNYNINYSCPNFSFDTSNWLSRYSHVVLILTATPTESLIAQKEKMRAKDFMSDTLKKYNSDSAELDLYARVSMYAFDKMKHLLNSRLLALEKTANNVVSVPPGSCSYCEICAKVSGEPCLHPDKLRYSLEALGFLVSQLLDVFFDYRINWQNRDFGEDFVTISALFSDKPIDEIIVYNKLKDIVLELPI